MKRFLLFAFLGVMILQEAVGQDTVKLSLQECVKIALENNLLVKRSVYNAENFRINMLQAKGAFLPTLSAGPGLGRNYGRSINPVTNSFIDKTTRTINVFGQSSWTLFNGLRNQNTFRQSQRDLVASNLDLEKTKNDVILNVVTYYTNVILNKELFENAKFQLNSSQQQLIKIKIQVEAGALSRSNELNQEATVASNETNLINQENNLNLSILQLKQAMQVPASDLFDIVIPQIPMEDLIIEQTPEDIYKISLQTLPQVKSALLKVESAELALMAARGSYYPRVTLTGTATSNYSSASDPQLKGFAPDGSFNLKQIGYVGTTSDPVFAQVPNTVPVYEIYNPQNQLKNNLYKQLSLGVTIPILNGFQTRTNVQRAIISQELADITVKETENTLRQSIETAYNNAVAGAKTYTAALRQVNASEEAYRMTKQRFDNGASSFVELQISSNDLFSAKSSLSRAKFNFLFSKKILDFYQGKQIEF